MKPIAIFQHDDCNFPAYFGEFLGVRGLPIRHIRLDLGEPVPDDVEAFAGLGFMGGVMSVNDEAIHPFLVGELRIIRDAHAAGIPVIGHCLGGQLISKALGGTVGRNRVKEVGWHPVRQLGNAAGREWFGELPQELTVMQWHNETFTLPANADWLLTGEHCDHQAFVAGSCLALQAHVEVTPEVVRSWTQAHARDLTETSSSVQSLEQILSGTERNLAGLRRIADQLYTRWTGLLRD
jgi:GMP synthase-like glutamine amidotransferase